MKTNLRSFFTFILSCGLALGGGRALAHDEPGGGDGPHFGFVLHATAAAPAGASGFVAVRSHEGAPELHVVTRGLDAGTYTVNVTAKDASVVALGTFDVHIPVDPPGGGGEGEPLESEAELTFPAGYHVADLASVQVADANAATLLTGDNVPPHDGPGGGPDHEHQHFLLVATADAPAGAKGHAEIEVEDGDHAAGAHVAALKIEVEGLAAGTYTVSTTSLVDGTATVLGTFDVAAPALDHAGDSETHASLPFPEGFNVMDVASVQVADANGVLLLAGDGMVKGGGIEGSEHLHEDVVLKPTTDAPAGAGGEAEIKAHNEEGVTTARLKIQTNGLAAGTYTVSVTSLADGTATVLGTFDVLGEPTEEDGDCQFGNGAALPFPAGFNPLDVATVQIADANGVVLLTGDFTLAGAANGAHFIAKVRVTPGAAGPAARGVATVSAHVRKHVLKQDLTLNAKGAPAGQMLTVKINGNVTGQVKVGGKGRVSVKGLPQGLSAHKVSTISLENSSGIRVLSAHF